MNPSIVATDVHKGFGSGPSRAAILQGISLEVRPGETVFLVGPSGSGKTTLLSVLGCILTPDQGGLRVLGQDVGKLSAEGLTAFRRKHLGIVFQTFNLFPTLAALDNVCLALTMRGLSLRQATERAAGLLD